MDPSNHEKSNVEKKKTKKILSEDKALKYKKIDDMMSLQQTKRKRDSLHIQDITLSDINEFFSLNLDDFPEGCPDDFHLSIKDYGKYNTFEAKSAFEKIIFLTGSLPRMAGLLIKIWKKFPKKSLSELEPQFSKEATTFFETRVNSVLKVGKDNEKTQREISQFATSIFLNRIEKNVPPLWENSGLLFEERDDNWKISCPAAQKAVISALYKEKDECIKIMAQDDSTIGRDFELFISSFFIGRKSIEVRNRNSRGEKREPKQLLLFSKEFIVQEKSKKYKISKFGKESMIICHKGHPAVDFVIHSTNGDIFFIQASLSTYANHDSKVNNLFDHQIQTDKGELSVLQYYISCARGDIPKISKYKIPEKCYYLYFTPREDLYKYSSKNSGSPVTLINLESDLSQLGTCWVYFKNYIEKYKK
eukprot:gene6776-10940_t